MVGVPSEALGGGPADPLTSSSHVDTVVRTTSNQGVVTVSLKALGTCKRSWCAVLFAAAATLGGTVPPARAETTVQVGISGIGVTAGAVVQIPVTAIVPIQTCNNNLAIGLIAVTVDAYTGSTCFQN